MLVPVSFVVLRRAGRTSMTCIWQMCFVWRGRRQEMRCWQ